MQGCGGEMKNMMRDFELDTSLPEPSSNMNGNMSRVDH